MNIVLMLFITASLLEVSQTSELIKKAVSFTSDAFMKYHLTSVVWVNCDGELVKYFLKLYDGTVVTIALKQDFELNNTDLNRNFSYKQTVFFAAELDEFKYFLQIINRVIVVPIKIIVVIDNRYLSTDIFTEFNKVAWDNDVADIVLVGTDINGVVSLKTYLPYDNGVCNNTTPVNLKPKTTKYFKEKFGNFNGCPIRVTLLENVPYVSLTKNKKNGTVTAIGGIDGTFLKLLIETVNSTMDIVTAVDNGVVSGCENGTNIGIFNDLVYNKADIMAPSTIIVSTRYARSQISYVYYTVKVMWCLPSRRKIYEWVKAILPFLNMSTPIITLAILIIIIMLRLIKKLGKIKETRNKGNLFEMIGIFLGQPVIINSRYKIINCLLIFWVWFCLIVRISYQGKLIDGLRKTILEQPIKTLDEALQVVDELGGLPTHKELYRNTSIENIYKHIKTQDLPNYLKDIAGGRRFLLAVDMAQLKYYRREVQILKERVTSLPACIHMRARWPAAPNINRLIGRIVETGLIHKIWNDMKYKWLLHIKDKNVIPYEPLDVEILSSCFYGLITMYFVSIFVFCIEIVLNRYKKDKFRSKLLIKFKS